MLLSFVPCRHSLKSIHHDWCEVDGFQDKRRRQSGGSRFDAAAALNSRRRGVHCTSFPSPTKSNSNYNAEILKRSSLWKAVFSMLLKEFDRNLEGRQRAWSVSLQRKQHKPEWLLGPQWCIVLRRNCLNPEHSQQTHQTWQLLTLVDVWCPPGPPTVKLQTRENLKVEISLSQMPFNLN